MSYMLLIIEPKGQREARSPEEGREAYARMGQFAQSLREQGLLLAADALKHETAGARVSVREGRSRTVDGPFSEAKEMIGGYYLLDCQSLAEATAIAAECPAAQWATVEVREIGTCYE